MFVLTELRRELRRSKRIFSKSKESSREFEKQYFELDEKYKLTKEKSKLERIPHVRRSIIKNFIKDINEARQFTNDNYEGKLKKHTVQRFLNKLSSMHSTNAAPQE